MDKQNKVPLAELYKELTSEETRGNYSVDYNMDESTAKAKFTNMIGLVSNLDTRTVNDQNIMHLRKVVRMSVADKYLVDKDPINYSDLEQKSQEGNIEFASRFLATLLKLRPNELGRHVNNDLVQKWLAANKDLLKGKDMTTLAKEVLQTEPELGDVVAAQEPHEIGKTVLGADEQTKPEGEEK